MVRAEPTTLQMNAAQRTAVEQIGDAASTNYDWRQQYGRNALWATDQITSGFDALTGAAAGTGQRLLALGYNNGETVGWGERIAGSIIGGTAGLMAGTAHGMIGALEFGRDAFGAALYEISGGAVFQSAYDRYGETAAGLVNVWNNGVLNTASQAWDNYTSRVGLLNDVDPLQSGYSAFEPVGELLGAGGPQAAASIGRGVTSVGRTLGRLPGYALENFGTGPVGLAAQRGVIRLDAFSPAAIRDALPDISPLALAALSRAQTTGDAAYQQASAALAAGRLRVNSALGASAEQVALGRFYDRAVRADMLDFQRSLSLSDQALMRVNNRLYGITPTDFAIPGLRFLGSDRLLVDYTVGIKDLSTPQLINFNRFAPNNNILIMTPNSGLSVYRPLDFQVPR